MCDKIMEEACLGEYIVEGGSSGVGGGCPKEGVLGYLQILSRWGDVVGNMCGSCLVIEPMGDYYVARIGVRKYPIYYNRDDVEPNRQQLNIGNMVWKPIEIGDGVTVSANKLNTKLIKNSETGLNNLYIVIQGCNLPLPVYIFDDKVQVQDKYVLIKDGQTVGDCPTCSGQWTWK